MVILVNERHFYFLIKGKKKGLRGRGGEAGGGGGGGGWGGGGGAGQGVHSLAYH